MFGLIVFLNQAKVIVPTSIVVSKRTIDRTMKPGSDKDEKPHLTRTERFQLDTFDLFVLHSNVHNIHCKQQYTISL